jgi:hypothetical protein
MPRPGLVNAYLTGHAPEALLGVLRAGSEAAVEGAGNVRGAAPWFVLASLPGSGGVRVTPGAPFIPLTCSSSH